MEERYLEEHEDHDMAVPQRPVYPPWEMNKHKRRPTWAREIIQDAEKNGASDESSKGSNWTHTHSICVALLCDIIDEKHSNNEDEAEKKECKDAMIEEYQPIMKNDVWDVVQRPVVKSVVPSKWIYKI